MTGIGQKRSADRRSLNGRSYTESGQWVPVINARHELRSAGTFRDAPREFPASVPCLGWAPRSRDLDFDVAARLCGTYCIYDRFECLINPRPAWCSENDDRYPTHIKILLILKVHVGRNQDVESVLFCGREELSVLQPRPASLVGSLDLVGGQGSSQRDWRPLV